MCLGVLAGPSWKKEFTRKVYWKVIYYQHGFEDYETGPFWKETIKWGKWMKAANSKFISTNDGRNYETGFHVFVRKKDAENYISNYNERVAPVRIKEITAIGWQGDRYTEMIPVVVARKAHFGKKRFKAPYKSCVLPEVKK